MLQSFYSTCLAAIFLLQLMCGRFDAKTTPAVQPVVTLVFISEDTEHHNLKTAFEFFLKTENEGASTLSSLQGITIEWKKNDTPNSTYEKIQENIIRQNVSAVVSFLPPKKNYILVNALSKAVIPVIGLQSLTEEFYSDRKVSEQANTLKDIYVYFVFFQVHYKNIGTSVTPLNPHQYLR